MNDISFSTWFDPQKSTKANVFEAVSQAGRVLAAGATALVGVKEALIGTSLPALNNNLLAAVWEISKQSKDLILSVQELTWTIAEAGKETLTSEITARVREDNQRLEGIIHDLKKAMEATETRHKEELRQKEFTQTMLALPTEDAEKFLRPILDEMLRKMLAEKRTNGEAS